MPFLLNAAPIQAAALSMEGLGGWSASVDVAGPLALAVGAPVVLTLGDTDFHGYVITGGEFQGSTTYALGAGGAGWSKAVAAKGHQDPAGVSLAEVATQLAAEAGEKIDVSTISTILGDHWTRPAGPASVALSALFPLADGGWRTDPDGITRSGARPPAPVPASTQIVVEDQRRADRWALLSLPDDAVSAVLPGAIITAANLVAPIVVRQTTIHVTGEACTVEVLGEGGLVELLVALVQALTPPRVFNGIWTYQVADVDNSRPNLRALSAVAGLPATLACDKIPGVPGWTSTLAANALVLIGFRDGSPARPYVAGYLPGVLPQALALAVAPGGTIQAGGSFSLVKDAQLQTWVAALTTAAAHVGLTVPALTGEATTVLKGA